MKTSFRCVQTVPCRTHAQARRFRDRLGQYRSHITDLRYKYALVGGAPSNNSLPNSDRQTNDTKKKKKKSPFISKSEKYDDTRPDPPAHLLSPSLSTTSMAMTIRVFFLALLLLASPFLLQVVRCESASDQVEAAEVVEESLSDLGYVADADQDDQVFSDENFGPAPGVETVCVFPKNSKKLVPAGEDSELLVGLKNEGESVLNVIALRASLHLPFDHHLLVQNLTTQQFNNASVPLSAQATFPYHFAVSKYLQPGTFDLVGTIIYEINQQAYQSTFYNGTIEVVEASGFLSIESVFLVTLGAGLLGFFILWVYGQIQNFSKKTKRVQKVEVGTGTTDSNLDEWLKGTAYAQANKSKKKK